MSFSTSMKNELARIPLEEKPSALAELAALIRMCGTIHLNNARKILKLNTENAAIARRIFSLIKFLYKTEADLIVRKNKQLKKNNNYNIVINNDLVTERILKDVGFITDKDYSNFIISYQIPQDLIKERECKRAYIRGSFLGGGSITNPEKTYHLEFVTNSLEHGQDLSGLINTFGLNSKVVARRDNFIVYLKEAEQIVDLLNITGAHQSLLELENIRVLKDIRNNINRLVNCETANLGKTIDASVRQIENIELIRDTIGFDKMPKNLREIALLRLEHRDATLKELGEKLDKPLGKSGVNHRFRKIEELANDIKRKKL